MSNLVITYGCEETTKVKEYAKTAGATYKMENKVLVNADIFEAYL